MIISLEMKHFLLFLFIVNEIYSMFKTSGIKVGDYLIRVGKTDIRWDSHEQAACLIHMLEDIVRVQVITPLGKNISKVLKRQ